MTIAGNLKDMFLNLTPASDLEFRHGTDAPTMRVDGMTVAGVLARGRSAAAKSLLPKIVIPAKAGIQKKPGALATIAAQLRWQPLGPRFREDDK